MGYVTFVVKGTRAQVGWACVSHGITHVRSIVPIAGRNECVVQTLNMDDLARVVRWFDASTPDLTPAPYDVGTVLTYTRHDGRT